MDVCQAFSRVVAYGQFWPAAPVLGAVEYEERDWPITFWTPHEFVGTPTIKIEEK